MSFPKYSPIFWFQTNERVVRSSPAYGTAHRFYTGLMYSIEVTVNIFCISGNVQFLKSFERSENSYIDIAEFFSGKS